MAQEINLTEQEAKELEAAQAKEVRDSQVANPPQQEEQKININLMTSVLICPIIQFVSNIVKSGDSKSDCYDLTISNQSSVITLRGTGEKLRGIKVGLIQAMQDNRIYILDVDEAIGGVNQVILYSFTRRS